MEVYDYLGKRVSKMKIEYKIKQDGVKFFFKQYSVLAPYNRIEENLRNFIEYLYGLLMDEFRSIYVQEDFENFCEVLTNHLDIIEMDLLCVDYVDLYSAKYTNVKSARNI
jgi:hypothetical protein